MIGLVDKLANRFHTKVGSRRALTFDKGNKSEGAVEAETERKDDQRQE